MKTFFKKKRQALHAQSIGFYHPNERKSMFFKSELPDEFKILQKSLENLKKNIGLTIKLILCSSYVHFLLDLIFSMIIIMNMSNQISAKLSKALDQNDISGYLKKIRKYPL